MSGVFVDHPSLAGDAGIYLAEFRHMPHSRRIVATILYVHVCSFTPRLCWSRDPDLEDSCLGDAQMNVALVYY